MDKRVKKRNILIIVMIFLVVLGGLSTMFYINLKENKTMEVEAIVKLIGKNYIIVEDSNGEEYSLETDDEYNVGDRIDFVIKDIKKNSTPMVGTVVKIDTISKNVNFSITDGNEDNIVKEEIIDDNKEVVDNSTSNNNYIASDGEIIEYFNNLNTKLTNYNGEDKNVGDSIKSGFVSVIDFLFYGGEIKGKTFNELSNSAKIKVLQLAFSIDEGIEKYFPGYKESISTTSKKVYTNVKEEATKLYLDITTSICTDDPDLCESAKDGLSDLKASFSLTWDFIVKAAGEGLSKLKAWYEVWRTA